jgi:predicted nucleic acid-binding protein
MKNVSVFVDTNVLIYSKDAHYPEKKSRADEWLLQLAAHRAAPLNLQVLNELTRWPLKADPGLALDEVRSGIDRLRIWGSAPIDDDIVDLAWALRAKFRFHCYDCLLLSAAVLDDCNIFLSEDMSHGARFERLTIINPFLVHPSEILAS